MSWSHVAWAAKQTAGGGTNKLVLLMIADSTSHDSPMLVIKMERMMKLCELKERTIRDALRDLEDRGLIGTVLRFFEGQQIANGYFLMGEEWVAAAKDRIDAENHRDGFSCRLRPNTVRDIPEHPSDDSRTPFDERPAPNAALGGRQMPGGAAPNAGQIQPSSFLPSSKTEFSASRASAVAAKQQSEKAVEISMPPELSTPEFVQAWELWKRYRIEKKKKLTPITVERQFAILSPLGVRGAIDTMNRSMDNGWTGLFPEVKKVSGRPLSPEQTWAKI